MTSQEQFAAKQLEAEALIREHAPKRLQEQLISLLRPAIALVATRTDDAQIPVGASKFGGAPDVPLDFVWPMWNDEPLGFLAQINLEEVAAFDVDGLLPKSGLLSFFYDMEEQPFGEAKQRDGWRVFLFELNLERNNSHPSSQQDLGTASVVFQPTWTVPNDAAFFPELNEGDGDEEEEQLELFYDDMESPSHHLFGHASVIQNEPALECEWWAEPKTEAQHWVLLLQIYSDPEFDAVWGDMGALYFMIRREDLEAKRFERTWLIMQCS